MGRKKRGFEWTADEDDPQRIQLVDRAPRSVQKKRKTELERLLTAILGLARAERRALPLDKNVLDEIDELAALPNSPARKRQFLFVKGLMEDIDVAVIDEALAGETPRAAWLRRVEGWRRRLLENGDDGMRTFLEAHPAVDRQQLRSLVRRATDDRGRRKLFDMLKEVVPQEP